MATFILVGSAVSFGLWAVASVIVVLSRSIHDRRRRRLDDLSRALTDPSVADLPPLRRAPTARRLLSRRSRLDIYRMLARTDAPLWLTELCAAYTVEHVGLTRLLADAAPGSGASKWRRVAALLALGHVRTEAAHDSLEAAVRDDDLDVASAAAAALRRLGDPRAGAALVTALQEGRMPRSRVATHLEQFLLPLAASLRPLLSDREPEVRQWAASLLRRYPEVDGLGQELAACTHDSHPPVRKCALQALDTMTADVALPAGRSCLADPVPYVRSAAIRLLGRHGAGMAGPGRCEVAAWITPTLADTAWEVRLAAKEALAQLGPTTWREIAAQLECPDAFARHGAAEVLMNTGVLDSTLREIVAGAEPANELRDLLSRALSDGGSQMVEAMKKRFGLETLPDAALSAVYEPGATT